MKRHIRFLFPLLVWCLLAGCGKPSQENTAAWGDTRPVGSMELTYAQQFTVDYYADGPSLISIGGSDRFLLLRLDGVPPEGLDAEVIVLRQPLDNIYLAASSAMDFFRALDQLNRVRLTCTSAANWSIPEVLTALGSGNLLYAGRYSAPDYELLLDLKSSLTIESTMIYHTPEVGEQLRELGIPMLVERSSYESHPLGRMEWIKLYGLLTGVEDKAAAFFDRQMIQLAPILETEQTENADLSRLLALCGRPAPPLPGTPRRKPPCARIAVAQDDAFCFAYAESLGGYRRPHWKS